MAKKVKVTKVEIEIGDSKHTLTLAQVRELRDVLNEAFPQDRPISSPIIIHDWPRPYRYWDPVWVTSPNTTYGTVTTCNTLSILAKHDTAGNMVT